MYKMIRCGTGFNLVIMVSPPDATIDTKDARYFRFATHRIDDCDADIFSEISQDVAVGYFGGIADGIGFAPVPAETFPTLTAAMCFILAHQPVNESAIRYKIADDVWVLVVYDNLACTNKRRICFPVNVPRKQAPWVVNIIDTTPPDRAPTMKKIEFLFNGERITGWVNADWLDIQIEGNAFDGRFNQPLE